MMGNASPPGNKIPDPIRPPLPSAVEQRRMRLAGSRVIIVSGGHDYGDWHRVWGALDMLHGRVTITLLVHGAGTDSDGLMGVDRWAEAWAENRGVAVERFPLDRISWGDGAKAMRNTQMLSAGAHGVVALPGFEQDLVREAEALGMLVWKPFG